MRVAVVGSRRSNLGQRQKLRERLDELHGIHKEWLHIVSGGCPLGADAWAEEWCKERGVPITIYYPKEQRARAFAERNSKIAKDCDCLLATLPSNPDFDRFAGTEQTVREARKLGKNVYCCSQGGEWQ